MSEMGTVVVGPPFEKVFSCFAEGSQDERPGRRVERSLISKSLQGGHPFEKHLDSGRVRAGGGRKGPGQVK